MISSGSLGFLCGGGLWISVGSQPFSRLLINFLRLIRLVIDNNYLLYDLFQTIKILYKTFRIELFGGYGGLIQPH